MTRTAFFAIVAFGALLVGCEPQEKPLVILKPPAAPAAADFTVRKEVRRVAFGSCAAPQDSMPALRQAAELKPDVFIWLGDNIYADTEDMDTLKVCYSRLAEVPEFQDLKAGVRMMATWDDHDYGWNDSGRHYAQRDSTKSIFLDFWEEPLRSPRRRRRGVHTSTLFDGVRVDVLVILLDTRTFRDDLIPAEGLELPTTSGDFYSADYQPHTSTDSTMLGEAQWAWLKAQFDVACDFRVIGSSTQFGISFNGYESWANFPHEQRRLLELLAEDAESRQLRGEAPIPTSFISGDVHYGEISALLVGADGDALPPGLAPIWDITSSGITSTWSFATANDNRMQGPVMENNIGLLEFLPSDSVLAQASLWDATGTQRAFQVLAERNP